jgi:hypothetical protein
MDISYFLTLRCSVYHEACLYMVEWSGDKKVRSEMSFSEQQRRSTQRNPQLCSRVA